MTKIQTARTFAAITAILLTGILTVIVMAIWGVSDDRFTNTAILAGFISIVTGAICLYHYEAAEKGW